MRPSCDRGHGRVRQGFDGHEPLLGNQGLHHGLAAVAVAHGHGVGFDFGQEAVGFQVFEDLLPAGKAVHAHVFAGSRGHLAGFVDDLDGGEVVAPGHLEVVEIVGRSDLQGAGAEIQGDVGIGDDRDGTLQDRQAQGGAVEFFVALVLGIDGHGGVAQEGLGAGGGHGEVAFPVGQGVLDMVKVAVMGVVLHLEVGQGRLAAGAPVDDVVALVDQALFIEAHEDLAHRPGQARVHGEALPAPVAGAAQALQLGDDLPAGLSLPLPDPLDKGLPAQGVAVFAFRGQLALHHVLGGDAGVVGAGHPQGVEAVHALEADQDVL